MPTSLTLDDHLAALESAGARQIALAEKAGLDADVPTCPAWTCRSLIAHQAMVHRWADAHVRGEDPGAVMNETDTAAKVDDLPAYYREGLARLVDALRAAPADLSAMTFLKDAPAPREFWARRQAHETTIHGIDALAATLGRWPTTAEADVDRAVAVDGIDELLRGFFTRGKSKLFDGTELDVAVVPTDSDRRWLLHVAEKLTVEPGDATDGSGAAATISGPAAAIYLALWNRGDEVQLTGDAGLLDRWRTSQRIGWS
jgi:uncharacterized protein (TIGR03083 family)